MVRDRDYRSNIVREYFLRLFWAEFLYTNPYWRNYSTEIVYVLIILKYDLGQFSVMYANRTFAVNPDNILGTRMQSWMTKAQSSKNSPEALSATLKNSTFNP